MFDFTQFYDLVASILPFKMFQYHFIQRAFLGLLILVPIASIMGIQVVQFRMAFFADAVSHSIFTGIAIGILFSIDPTLSVLIFGLLIGMSIVLMHNKSTLSTDTVIGVFFSIVVAVGIALVSRYKFVAHDLQKYIYGDILSVTDSELLKLLIFAIVLIFFQVFSYNKLLYIGVNPILARTHKIRVSLYQYIYAALLSLVVIFSVRVVGILLVTAMLVVPAGASRNIAHSARGVFWFTILISVFSSISGLIISIQDWARIATGATVVIIMGMWFIFSMFFVRNRKY